ncbi:two-component system response regulator [Maridesulfovibrio sp.]|uniref:HD-GYP domain-containing protein n=1 Tax=Maridesulfovibrio sp. TaxID=2795000 RepID=UPI002AA5E2F8|nr:two-component system response regulator [Maridesulfovibrio sp.]
MSKNASRQTVLVVDDSADNIAVFSKILSEKYRVKAAKNGAKALQIAFATVPDIILLDIMMPGIDGYEICRQLKKDSRTQKIPIIFVTAKDEIEDETKGFELGAVDYIAKPVSPSIVLARVKTHLQLYDNSRELENAVLSRTKELAQSQLEIIRRLGRAAEYKDNETGMHVIRMSYYSCVIARSIGMDDATIDLLLNATPMHDVGKIGISDSILLKAGKLTEQEREEMEKHCEFGAEIIGEHDDKLLKLARSVALTHHEKWDGSGYPKGLKGTDIPIEGRIVAIADVFDALTSRRSYKEPWPIDKAISFIEEQAGRHFDPELVAAFINNISKVIKIYEKNREECHVKDI